MSWQEVTVTRKKQTSKSSDEIPSEEPKVESVKEQKTNPVVPEHDEKQLKLNVAHERDEELKRLQERKDKVRRLQERFKTTQTTTQRMQATKLPPATTVRNSSNESTSPSVPPLATAAITKPITPPSGHSPTAVKPRLSPRPPSSPDSSMSTSPSSPPSVDSPTSEPDDISEEERSRRRRNRQQASAVSHVFRQTSTEKRQTLAVQGSSSPKLTPDSRKITKSERSLMTFREERPRDRLLSLSPRAHEDNPDRKTILSSFTDMFSAKRRDTTVRTRVSGGGGDFLSIQRAELPSSPSTEKKNNNKRFSDNSDLSSEDTENMSDVTSEIITSLDDLRKQFEQSLHLLLDAHPSPSPSQPRSESQSPENADNQDENQEENQEKNPPSVTIDLTTIRSIEDQLTASLLGLCTLISSISLDHHIYGPRIVQEIQPDLPPPQPQPQPELTEEQKEVLRINKRYRVEQEIVESELSYQRQLTILIESYLIPLEKNESWFNIKKEDIQTIFSNVRIIQGFSSKLIDEFSVLSKEPDLNQPVTDHNQSLAGIFVKMAPFLKVYTTYIANYDKSAAFLETIKGKNEVFSKFLVDTQKNVMASRTDRTDLDLISLLLVPVQRIPRYILLFQELLRLTLESEEQFNLLEKAITILKQIATQLNESRSTKSLLNKTFEIQNALETDYLNLVEPHRRFLKEGFLTVTWTQHPYDGLFIMFNDLLIYVLSSKAPGALTRLQKSAYKFKGFFLLQKIESIDDLPESRGFEIVYKDDDKGNSVHYLVLAKDEQDKENWMKALNQQIEICKPTKLTSKNDLFKDTMFSGFLNKRGENVKNWKRRLFKLKGRTLYYYTTADNHVPIGAISLGNFGIYLAEEKMKKECCLELRHPENSASARCWFVQAEDSDALCAWIDALQDKVIEVDVMIQTKYLNKKKNTDEISGIEIDNLDLSELDVDQNTLDKLKTGGNEDVIHARHQTIKKPVRLSSLFDQKEEEKEIEVEKDQEQKTVVVPEEKKKNIFFSEMESLSVGASDATEGTSSRQTIGKKAMQRMIKDGFEPPKDDELESGAD